ncbi:MAG: hypothetical protein R2911_32420 [Caldilineaceae bacterium]
MALGWLEQIPRLYGVQSPGSAADNARRDGVDFPAPVQATTRADSIMSTPRCH